MTPAINIVRKQKITHQIHSYDHEESSQAYGLEAAEKLGISAERVFKTLVVSFADVYLAVGIVPVAVQLNLKQMAKAVGTKKVAMADPAVVERVTGYVLGGVSPLGQKRRLPTILDRSAERFETIFVSAGRRGLEIELSPEDLLKLTNARLGQIVQLGD